MQVFKLVDPGRVDRIIAFDSLPESMVKNIKRANAIGFPRPWLDFLGVKRGSHDPVFYVLDFRTINRDKEKFQEIQNYIRRSVDKNFRLMDNIYDMAKQLSIDSYSSLDLEPEDIVVIPVPNESEIIQNELTEELEDEPRKRGRPKKEVAQI